MGAAGVASRTPPDRKTHIPNYRTVFSLINIENWRATLDWQAYARLWRLHSLLDLSNNKLIALNSCVKF